MDPLNNGLTSVASTLYVNPSTNNSAPNVTAIRPLTDRASTSSDNLKTTGAGNTSNDQVQNGQTAQTGEVNKKQVEDAVKSVNDFFQVAKHTLQFSLNEDSGKMVVEIKDEKTGKVIRQIPSKEALELAKSLDDFQGLLFKDTA